MRIVTYPEADTPAELRAQVVALQEQAWPSDTPPDPSAPTHDPRLRPQSVLLVDDERVVAALDILRVRITHAGASYAAAGLSTVVTDKALRGNGYGLQLARAAHRLIAEAGDDVGLFTCDRELAGFYQAAGWRLLPGTVLIGGTRDDPFPSDGPGFDKVTLADFFTEHGRAGAAAFEQARIELYPGTIDRLW